MKELPAGASFTGSLLLAGAIVLSRSCRKLTLQIERRWHALSAGVAVAYVFVSVMPELEEHRPARAETEPRFWWFVGGAAAYGTILMLI